eukprot:GHVO01037201.1.p3 GENE.GHVO01037201.1~~GHVO01037201.1.p3  ORF type:complete len:111 (+),score=8.13 GHVO01037201.1:1202-1534(+)
MLKFYSRIGTPCISPRMRPLHSWLLDWILSWLRTVVVGFKRRVKTGKGCNEVRLDVPTDGTQAQEWLELLKKEIPSILSPADKGWKITDRGLQKYDENFTQYLDEVGIRP